jgi:hypothetical protein
METLVKGLVIGGGWGMEDAGQTDFARAAEAAATTTGSLANRARLFGVIR